MSSLFLSYIHYIYMYNMLIIYIYIYKLFIYICLYPTHILCVIISHNIPACALSHVFYHQWLPFLRPSGGVRDGTADHGCSAIDRLVRLLSSFLGV